MKLHYETDARSADTLETYVCLIFACQEDRTGSSTQPVMFFTCNTSSNFTNDVVTCNLTHSL